MKTTNLKIALCLLAAVSSPILNSADSPPTPGVEQKKLEMVVGVWKGETVSVETPLGPAGKTRVTSENRMILGGLFLEGRGEFIGSDGTNAFLQILAWNPTTRRFTESLRLCRKCGERIGPLKHHEALERDPVQSPP